MTEERSKRREFLPLINTYTTVYQSSFLEIMFFRGEKSPYENVKAEWL